jgi:hypothetical protein
MTLRLADLYGHVAFDRCLVLYCGLFRGGNDEKCRMNFTTGYWLLYKGGKGSYIRQCRLCSLPNNSECCVSSLYILSRQHGLVAL